MRFYELLEGRDAPLYHATDLVAMVDILGSNVMQGRANLPSGKFSSIRDKDQKRFVDVDQHVHGVSLTRDLRFAQYWDDYVFVFNQGRLNQRFRIQPFYYFQQNKQYRQGENAEAEEFLLGNISNVSKYIDKIIVADDALDEIEEYKEYLFSHPDKKKLNGLMRLYHFIGDQSSVKEIQNFILKIKTKQKVSTESIHESKISDIISNLKEKLGNRYPQLLDHLRRLKNEMNETTEVGKLIIRATKGQQLTPMEINIIKEQFKDLARLIWIGWPQLQPLPGVGILWIPIAIKLLKVLNIDHRPSSWRDDNLKSQEGD